MKLDGVPDEKIEVMNRAQKRAARSRGSRTGNRTGTSPHFERWKAEGRIKSALQKLKTGTLADEIVGNDKAASGFALLFLAGFKTVWDVSQAKRADLLAARGVGIATLGHVEDYLKAKQVDLKWSVHN
jgi:hypothetical protein